VNPHLRKGNVSPAFTARDNSVGVQRRVLLSIHLKIKTALNNSALTTMHSTHPYKAQLSYVSSRFMQTT